MYSKFRMKLEKKKEENLEEHPWYREFKKIELDLSKNTGMCKWILKHDCKLGLFLI